MKTFHQTIQWSFLLAQFLGCLDSAPETDAASSQAPYATAVWNRPSPRTYSPDAMVADNVPDAMVADNVPDSQLRPEFTCATAPLLLAPTFPATPATTGAWRRSVISDTLVVAESDEEAVLHYRVSLPVDGIVAVRTNLPAQLSGTECRGGPPIAAASEVVCSGNRTRVIAFHVVKGDYVMSFRGTRLDRLTATVQYAPAIVRPGSLSVASWGTSPTRAYLSSFSSDPIADMYVPPCGVGPRPWSTLAMLACPGEASRVRVEPSPYAGQVAVAVVEANEDVAVCTSAARPLEHVVDPDDVFVRVVQASSDPHHFGGVWITASLVGHR